MKRRRDKSEEPAVNIDDLYNSCHSFWKNYAIAMKWQKDFMSDQRRLYYQHSQEPPRTEPYRDSGEDDDRGSCDEDHRCSCVEDDRGSCDDDDRCSCVEDDVKGPCVEDHQCSCVEDHQCSCVEDHQCSCVEDDSGSRSDDNTYLCAQDDRGMYLKGDDRRLYVEDDDNGGDNSSMEIEVSEEFLEYLRSKMRKQKEADAEPPTKVMARAEPEPEKEEKPQFTLGNTSSNRRTLMYGESACMIAAMEAAMDVNFSYFSHKKKVVPWPVIPIKF